MRCLRAALKHWEINPGEQMRTVIGTASAGDPEEVKGSIKPRVLLQWRLDRADEHRISKEITAWRKNQCHSSNPGVYNVLKKAYDKHQKEEKKKQKYQPARDPVEIEYLPPHFPSNRPGHGMPPRASEKRRHGHSSSPGPSQKRRDLGPQWGTFSSSQPVTTSAPEPSRSTAAASSGSTYQQQEIYPGPDGMIVGAKLGAGSSSGSSYGQPAVTAVTRGMSNMAITAPAPATGGFHGQNPPPPPPTNYGAPRPVPVQMRHPQPSQYEGYATPQPGPSQGYPPQGTSGGPYNTPYSQGTGGNPQQARGFTQQPPYQSAPAGSSSQSGRDDSSRHHSSHHSSSSHHHRGKGHHSSSKDKHHGHGGSSRR